MEFIRLTFTRQCRERDRVPVLHEQGVRPLLVVADLLQDSLHELPVLNVDALLKRPLDVRC